MINRKLYVIALIVFIILVFIFIKIYFPDFISFKYAQPASQKSIIPEKFKLGEVKSDINYCGQQKLDFYTPRVKIYDKQPLVIYIHGGSWKANNKTSDPRERALLDGLRDKGFALASIDYRLTPKYKYPEPQQDALCAVRFLRANHIRFSLDPDKFVVAGFSAGGNLAALAGVLDSHDGLNNGQYKDISSRVQAVVGIAGVYDFQRNLKPNSIANIRNLMQGVKRDAGAPIAYVTPDDPPFLLIHGENDSVVLPIQDKLFSEKLKSAGIPYEQIVVRNAEHNLAPSGREISPTSLELSKLIQDFIIRKLRL